jgi:hypothetical protein
MIKVPGDRPFVPHITPKEAKAETPPEDKPVVQKPVPQGPGIGRGPEMDARAIAVRLAALATEAKEKEISAEEFDKILEEVIDLTGITEPEAAMEEANRRLQKEIEEELQRIKENKELMDEAESWQNFAELLSRMSKEQIEGFLSLMKETIKDFA